MQIDVMFDYSHSNITCCIAYIKDIWRYRKLVPYNVIAVAEDLLTYLVKKNV
jgi:hypothetical protein